MVTTIEQTTPIIPTAVVSASTNNPSKTKTITLCMIVKDEARVIERCLASVLPLIDNWVIVDTGSTDGTQELIKYMLKDLVGLILYFFLFPLASPLYIIGSFSFNQNTIISNNFSRNHKQ